VRLNLSKYINSIKKLKHLAPIASTAAAFTFYWYLVGFINFKTSYLNNAITADFLNSSCFVNGNYSFNNTESNIDTAVSLLPTTADFLATVSASPYYYMSYMIPSNWSDKRNIETIRAQFYAGMILLPFVTAASFSLLYFLPDILYLPLFSLKEDTVCFYKDLARNLSWTTIPMSAKTWLEQFLFAGSLIHNTWIPSLCAMLAGLVIMLSMKNAGVSYYYILLSIVVEIIVLASHALTYGFNKKIKSLGLHKGTSFEHMCQQVKISLKGLYAVGLTVGSELAVQMFPVYLANQFSVKAPKVILESQQIFYLVYIWQVATSIQMSIEVSNAKKNQQKLKSPLVYAP